ncbi:cupin domain-containing protein [Afifella pfennigii]|uniref:cupin domain-containing protein n=1 Tax=Afifella pfennigii TaxID=209897 RepID=UPI000691F255|nr:cupin domain-containing protein [Afifella pfennigii]
MIAYKAGGSKVALTPLAVKPDIIAGDPVEASARIVDAAGGGPIRTGIYEVTKGSFRITFAFHELATVLEGEVELVDAAGNAVTYGPGDSWFCEKGETVTWTVKSDRLRKCFMAVDPDHLRRDGGAVEPLTYKGPAGAGGVPVLA